MTTTAQQTVLTEQEIACLRDFAAGALTPGTDNLVANLAAKGMIDDAHAAQPNLTPAGRHALHVDEPGCVPGIDS